MTGKAHKRTVYSRVLGPAVVHRGKFSQLA